ncbi:hypothetical protein RHODOP_04774 [Rhodoplanes sp. P11]|uniref:PD-(D/E)XK nuclease-like domain-containing protein n=1 Tax=Rhodoplanes sp. P11 TaxID=3157621 RepID=UPI0035E9B982
MSRITTPGFYPHMSAGDYHADPCPEPSLTQSIAKLLLERSPLHAWHVHPRLNPAFAPEEPTRFDVAHVAHTLLLGRGKDVAVIDAADWRTKAAKEERDDALARGRLPILAEQYERARLLVDRARDQLSAAGLGEAFSPDAGDGEMVIAWQDGDGLWRRAMIDWLSHDRRLVLDYKTTLASAAPHAIPTKMAADGWCIQAAQHEAGLDILDPETAGRRRHIFVCQEATEPYALSIVEIPEAAMTIGRRQLAMARDIWSACSRAGIWPGYPRGVIRPAYPEWAESRWIDREIDEFADVVAPLRAPIARPAPMLTDLAGG